MQSKPSTAEEPAVQSSTKRLAPRVLKAILSGFASKDKHRGAITSIILGPLGWFATNTHRIVWSGELPTPQEAYTTDPRSVRVEVARAEVYGDTCDLEKLTPSDGAVPNARRVIPNELFPFFDVTPEQLAELAKLGKTLGAKRITLCLEAELGPLDETSSRGRVLGFRIIRPEEETVYGLIMGFSPDGLRAPVRIENAGYIPAIKGYPANDGTARPEAA